MDFKMCIFFYLIQYVVQVQPQKTKQFVFRWNDISGLFFKLIGKCISASKSDKHISQTQFNVLFFSF